MLQEGFAHAEEDVNARRLREARVEAQRLVLATRSALAADGELIPAAERTHIEALVSQAEAQADGEDPAAIDAAVERLATGTEAFAAARMNRGIRAALTGRKVEEV